jgi:chromosome segregation ATPase
LKNGIKSHKKNRKASLKEVFLQKKVVQKDKKSYNKDIETNKGNKMSHTQVQLENFQKAIKVSKQELKELNEKVRETNKKIKKLSSEENFVEAQKELVNRKELENKVEVLKVDIDGMSSLIESLEEDLKSETNFHFSSEKIYQVCVYSPKTEQYTNVVYVESSDTIRVELDDEFFENEAYHLGSWCREHGFLYELKTAQVDNWI